MLPSHRPRHRALLAAAFFALIATGACKEGLSGFGAGTRARTGADEFFASLADRHLDIVRNQKYEYARVQLSHGALSPSHVFDDTAAWTSSSGPVRMLETFGTHSDQKYIMTSRPAVTAPVKTSDGRHITTLTRLTDNEYRWDTTVDFGLGSIRPNDLALVFSRLLTAGEGLGEREARADLASSMPRTSAALGTLFSLDSLRPVVQPDGSTAVMLAMGIHTDQLKSRFPNFSEFAHKYIDPARLHITMTDRGGVPYLELQSRDRMTVIRLRTQGGHLVPLNGGTRPLPDSLNMLVDFTMKMKLFHVGFHDLSMDFVNTTRGDAERTWTINARKEPQWNLPFITGRLIRSPLRRPFAGEGALFRIGVRADASDQQTILVRQSRLAVQESAILKFVNSLTNTAMDDFSQRAEKEENQWLREVFFALRDDARGVIAP